MVPLNKFAIGSTLLIYLQVAPFAFEMDLIHAQSRAIKRQRIKETGGQK